MGVKVCLIEFVHMICLNCASYLIQSLIFYLHLIGEDESSADEEETDLDLTEIFHRLLSVPQEWVPQEWGTPLEMLSTLSTTGELLSLISKVLSKTPRSKGEEGEG